MSSQSPQATSSSDSSASWLNTTISKPRWSCPLWRNAPGSTRAEQWRKLAIETALYEQIWRTGRAPDVGLCPREPVVKRVPDLERRSADDSIGTAHPLFVNGIGKNGAWYFVCQGRHDTNGDGAIDVRVDHHFYAGDEVRPYLVWGSGPGWQIDEFVSADPLGNVVAVADSRGGSKHGNAAPPGLDGTGRLFRPLEAHLPPPLRPCVVTFPSDQRRGYDELLRAIVVPRGTFAIVAESFSGPLAIRIAHAYPDRVERWSSLPRSFAIRREWRHGYRRLGRGFSV